jgi:ketosteroid isomerase-like protein
MSRVPTEQLLQALYAARMEGQLDSLCALFSPDAKFRISGTSDGKPIAIAAQGVAEIRPWLAMMVKTFKLGNLEIMSMTIDGEHAAVHWRAEIHSKITGVISPTEMVDLVQIRNLQIYSYIEFFMPS